MKVKEGFSSLSNSMSPFGRITLPPTTSLIPLIGTNPLGTWTVRVVDNGTSSVLAKLNYFVITYKFTICGNGVLDPGTFEICDGSINCGPDCISCINGYS